MTLLALLYFIVIKELARKNRANLQPFCACYELAHFVPKTFFTCDTTFIRWPGETEESCSGFKWDTQPIVDGAREEEMLNRFNIALAMAHRGFRFANFGKKGIKKTMTGKDLGKMH